MENNTVPEVISFDQYAARHDNFTFSWDVATNRLPNTSEGQRKRIQAREQAIQRQEAARRVQLRQQYDDEVNAGRIRPPTRDELLIQRARGHSDNPAVQAARRSLEKRGIRWEGEVE